MLHDHVRLQEPPLAKVALALRALVPHARVGAAVARRPRLTRVAAVGPGVAALLVLPGPHVALQAGLGGGGVVAERALERPLPVVNEPAKMWLYVVPGG